MERLGAGMNVLVYFNWPVKFWNIPVSHVELLRRRFPEMQFTQVFTEQEAAAKASNVTIILTARIQPSIIQHAPGLRWLQSSASSVSTLPLSELASRDVVVTNTRTIQGGPIAEHVLGGILVLSRRFSPALAAQRERRWIQNELGAGLSRLVSRA